MGRLGVLAARAWGGGGALGSEFGGGEVTPRLYRRLPADALITPKRRRLPVARHQLWEAPPLQRRWQHLENLRPRAFDRRDALRADEDAISPVQGVEAAQELGHRIRRRAVLCERALAVCPCVLAARAIPRACRPAGVLGLAQRALAEQRGPEDGEPPLVYVGDAPDVLECVVAAVKVLLHEVLHHPLVEVVLLGHSQVHAEQLEDEDEDEVEAGLEGDRVKESEDPAKGAAAQTGTQPWTTGSPREVSPRDAADVGCLAHAAARLAGFALLAAPAQLQRHGDGHGCPRGSPRRHTAAPPRC